MIPTVDELADDVVENILRGRTPADAAAELHRCYVGIDQVRGYATRKMGILSSMRHQVLAELAALEDGPTRTEAVAWKPGDRR